MRLERPDVAPLPTRLDAATRKRQFPAPRAMLSERLEAPTVLLFAWTTAPLLLYLSAVTMYAVIAAPPFDDGAAQ